jgi:hypothetical protein
MKNVVSKKSDRRSSLFARVVAKIYETPSSKSSGGNYETLSRKFTLSWSHYVLLMRISGPVEYPRRKERRWGVRRGTIDVRRREARDVRRVSCLTSHDLAPRLSSNVSRPPNPPKGTHL